MRDTMRMDRRVLKEISRMVIRILKNVRTAMGLNVNVVNMEIFYKEEKPEDED